MKRILIVIALGLVCATFFSCKFKSKEQRDAEKFAMEYCSYHNGRFSDIKYKLVKTEVIPHPAKIKYGDIVYHVAHLYRNKRGRIIAYDIDSVGVERRDFPDYNEYQVTIRRKKDQKTKEYTYNIARRNGENPDWDKYENTVIIDKKTPIATKYHLEGWELLFSGIEEGQWYNRRQLSMDSESVKSEDTQKKDDLNEIFF